MSPPHFVLGGTSQQAALQNVSICFCCFIGFFLSLRIYTRLVLIRAVGWEDGMVLLSSILGICACIVTIVNTSYGLGEHLSYIQEYRSEEDLFSLFKLIYSYSLLYYIATSIAKLSIALMMLRIFPIRWFRYFIFCVMTFITCSCCCSIAVSVIVKWSFPEYHGETEVETKFNYVFSALNACFDFSLVMVPVPLVWRLQMPLRTRLLVCCLFATGLLGCTASLIRLGTIHFLLNPDTTWYFGTCIIWTTVEGSIAIICAILPVLKPFFDQVLPKILPAKWVNEKSGRTGHSTNPRSEITKNGTRKSRFGDSVIDDEQELKLSPVGVRCYPAPNIFDDELVPEHGVRIKTEFEIKSFKPRNLDDSESSQDLTDSAEELGMSSPRDVEEGIDFTKPPKTLWR